MFSKERAEKIVERIQNVSRLTYLYHKHGTDFLSLVKEKEELIKLLTTPEDDHG